MPTVPSTIREKMDKKVRAIVTRAVPYREADLILTLVSPEEGRLTASAKGCLKPRAKLRYAASIMNFGEYMLSGKGDRYVVTDCVQYDSFSVLTEDLGKYYAACFVLELLTRLSPEPQPQLFLHAAECLRDMAYGGAGAPEAACDFMKNALADNGSCPDCSTCAACRCVLDGAAVFTESEGVVCPHCAPQDGIAIDAVTRAYIAGERRDIPAELKTRSIMLLADLVQRMLGVRADSTYFREIK